MDVVATRPSQHPATDFDVVDLMDRQGGRWVVRAPKDAAAGAALEAEIDLLAGLRQVPDLMFEVAHPTGFAPLDTGGRAVVHPDLPGTALNPEQVSHALARNVGRVLAQIHDMDTGVIADAGLPVYSAQEYRTRRLAEVDEAAATGHVPSALLKRWEQALEDVAMWKFIPSPCHGDIAGEHLLVADDGVASVLNWSQARVADPADDLAWLIAAVSEEASDLIMESYLSARGERADEFLEARALLASELALARWLMHGVRVRDNEIIDDAVDMLADLDAGTQDADPIGYVEPEPEPEPEIEPEPGPEPDIEPEPAYEAEFEAEYESADEPEYEPEYESGFGDVSKRTSSGPNDPTGAIPTSALPGGTSHDDDGDLDEAAEDDLREPDYGRSGGNGDDSPTGHLPAVDPGPRH